MTWQSMRISWPFLLAFVIVAFAIGAELYYPYNECDDISQWQRFGGEVVHPASVLKPQDLQNARNNMARFQWARRFAGTAGRAGDRIVSEFTPEYLDMTIPRTTPGGQTPCPACRDKGLRWLPNNDWKWNYKKPDELLCPHCKTIFPNEKYPETIRIQSKWDPEQVFTFIDTEPFECFKYKSLSSPSGVIRKNKLSHVLSGLNTLTRAYALNPKTEYAETIRLVLLKLADRVPKYLIRAGYTYNEYADCSPREAAKNLFELPCDEIVTKPNKPDRRLHTGYWSASRTTTAGMDGRPAQICAEAYDISYDAKDKEGKPLYDPQQRRHIEEDLLLELAYLLCADKSINNKSVSNMAGAAAIGVVLGIPDMLRFALNGFAQTVDGWFLKDGGTSESAAYANMTMAGLVPFAYILRDYSEPDAYTPPANARRLSHFNACQETRFGECWQAMVWTLQGDLLYPPLADSYQTTKILPSYAELIALNFPRPEYSALRDEAFRIFSNHGNVSVFYGGQQGDKDATFALPDKVFPYLAQGIFRLGKDGRQAMTVLNASNWGIHHHRDSLNLYYWKDGHELLGDLGYLWDHPDKKMTVRTLAHNLVLIDGRDQESKGRNGSFHFYAATPRIKAMRASSQAYKQASTYQRTILQISHGEHGDYLLDLFKAQGGKRREYIFHGPNNDFEVTPPMQNNAPDGANPWSITWKLAGDYRFTAFSPGAKGEAASIKQDWGQRDSQNKDRGATLPYIRRLRKGPKLDTFASVFCGYKEGRQLVKGMQFIELPDGAAAVQIDTTLGTDIVIFAEGASAAFAGIETDAAVAAVLRDGSTFMLQGTKLQAGGKALQCGKAAFSGKILAIGNEGMESSWFEVDADISKCKWQGQALIVTGQDDMQRAYPMLKVEAAGQRTRIYTKTASTGFTAQPAQKWLLPSLEFQVGGY